MVLISLLEKGFWAGFAALGFAILFNVPQRTLLIIWVMGALGGLTKFFLLGLDVNIVLASLVGASLIGVLSVYAAHNKQAPPLVFSTPSVFDTLTYVTPFNVAYSSHFPPKIFEVMHIFSVLQLRGA